MVGFVVFFCTNVTRCHGLVGFVLLDCFYMILTVCLVGCVVFGGIGLKVSLKN